MRKTFAGLRRHGAKRFRGGTASPCRPLSRVHPHRLHRHSAGSPGGAGTELRGPEGAAERGPPRPSGRRGADPIPLRGWGSSAPPPGTAVTAGAAAAGGDGADQERAAGGPSSG